MLTTIIICAVTAVAAYCFGAMITRRSLSSEAERARTEAATAKALLESERTRSEKTLKAQADALRAEFRATAAELAQSEAKTLRERHVESLESLLTPLGKDIEAFREQFLKGNADIGRYIKDLVATTTEVGKTTTDLANALRANSKIQGNWGEAVLGNLLEASGLTRGRDFIVQARTNDRDTGSVLIPDVVVKLPGNRSVIIDSKVSLTAFTDYVATAGEADATESTRLMKEHLASVRKHVKELSDKDYARVVPDSIGYVLMFIPSEAAYVAAVTADPSLTTDAYARHIIIINPTNLLMALQLAHNLWQSELQSRSVSEIYESAGKLYKKFALFAENFVKIGDGLGRLSDLYVKTEKQLSSGRGSIVSQLEGWKKKGLNPPSTIPKSLTDNTGEEE